MRRPTLIFATLLTAFTGFAHAQDMDALKLDTRKNALPVLPKVVAMMQETVAAKGAAGAVPVCKDEAPRLLREQAEKTGWAMRRVSLKTRNPERGTPDLWEARQLADFNVRAMNGEKAETLETGEVIAEVASGEEQKAAALSASAGKNSLIRNSSSVTSCGVPSVAMVVKTDSDLPPTMKSRVRTGGGRSSKRSLRNDAGTSG